MHLIVDSTGLKRRGAGEWLSEKHGISKRRSWGKLHIGIDADRSSPWQSPHASEDFAPALRAIDGGLTLSGGEPLVQQGFSRRLFAAAKTLGLHTAPDTSGCLGARADDAYLDQVDLVLLDIESGDPAAFHRLTGVDLAPTLRFAERLAAISKPVWVRYVLVPGLTDDSAHTAPLPGLWRRCAMLKRSKSCPSQRRVRVPNWSLDAFDEECGGVPSNDA